MFINCFIYLLLKIDGYGDLKGVVHPAIKIQLLDAHPILAKIELKFAWLQNYPFNFDFPLLFGYCAPKNACYIF